MLLSILVAAFFYDMKKILTKLRSLELYLSAHPDNEPGSEAADRLSDAQEIIEELVNEIPINCLAYALRFWRDNKKYKILYDGNHVINTPAGVDVAGFLPLGCYGSENLLSSFRNDLLLQDAELLKEYLITE